MNNNVTVLVRCRPALPSEMHLKCSKIECNEINNTVRVQSVGGNADKVFSFNGVFPESATQEDIFEAVSPVIDRAVAGYMATLFVYGSTGAGKSWTLEGLDYTTSQPAASASGFLLLPSADRDARNNNAVVRPDLRTPKEKHGIALRTMEALFERVRAKSGGNKRSAKGNNKDDDDDDDDDDDPIMGGAAAASGRRFRVRVSFMQLYNEKLTDLITKRTDLKLRWTSHGTFAVDGLTRSQCENAEQVRELFFMAVKNKAMGAHAMNQQSSRSHCLYTFHIEQWNDDAPESVVRSELTLVDLAGSEKLAMMAENPSAQLLRESIDINTSLLALGKVITALAARASAANGGGGAPMAHVPYRESKLTKLLQHALGGNAFAVMIACITPLDAYVEETTSTLMYAGRAKNIRNDPRVNEDPRAALIRQLRDENSSLKAELAQYRQYVLNGTDMHLDAAMVARQQQQQQQKRGGRGVGGGGGVDDDADDAAAMSLVASPTGRSQSLAEKLLSSCTMLKEVVAVNGTLRTAFDSMHALKKQAERREAELQAENLALRERIDMLESIALKEDDDEDEDNENGDEESGGVNVSRGPSASSDLNDSYSRAAVAQPASAASTPAGHRAYGRQRLPSPVGSSASAPVSAEPLPTGGFGATRLAGHRDGGALSAGNTPLGKAAQQPQPFAFARASSSSQLPQQPQQMTPQRPSLGAGGGFNFAGPAARSFAAAGAAGSKQQQQQQQQQRSSSNGGNRATVTAAKRRKQQQLEQYADKYRRPDWVSSSGYDTYYDIARDKQKKRAPALGIDESISQLARALPQATRDLLPPDLVAGGAARGLGNGSGRNAGGGGGSSGLLAFGGATLAGSVSSSAAGLGGASAITAAVSSEVSDLEERRRQRQARLQALQERHKQLQAGGSLAAAAFVEQQQQHQQVQAQFMAPPPSFSGRGNGNGNATAGYNPQQGLRPLPPQTYNSQDFVHFGGGISSAGGGAPRSLGGGVPLPLHQEQSRVSDLGGNNTPMKFTGDVGGPPFPRSQAPPQQQPPGFRFLNSDDLRGTFSDEQLAILKRRAANLSPDAASAKRRGTYLDESAGVGGVSPPSPAPSLQQQQPTVRGSAIRM